MACGYHSKMVHEKTDEIVQPGFRPDTSLPFGGGTTAAVRLDLTVDQAKAVAKALDIFVGLSTGQVNMLSEMVSMEEIPMHARNGEPRKRVDTETRNFVREQISAISYRLGYSGTGHSLGIGSEHVPIAGRRAYEVSRVLEKALAEHRDPNPGFRGASYDGLKLRYTGDPAPQVSVNNQVRV